MPERAVRNSLLIRGVNERINGLSDSWFDDEPRELLCECGDESCIEAILVTRADYEVAMGRAGPVPGHFGPLRRDGRPLLMTRDGYSIVEYGQSSG